jgi:hypothetical protein
MSWGSPQLTVIAEYRMGLPRVVQEKPDLCRSAQGGIVLHLVHTDPPSEAVARGRTMHEHHRHAPWPIRLQL